MLKHFQAESPMAKMLYHFSSEGYRFESRYPLTGEDQNMLAHTFRHADGQPCSTLGGRCSTYRIGLSQIGPVVVKHYRRGGVLANFMKDTYLAVGKRRCQSEFELMDLAIRLGVSVPEPILYAYKGHLFYKAWLVTREIEQAQSIAQISQTAPARAAAAMKSINRELSVLIDHSILHSDFHPGNVLIDDKDRIFLIDFDKACPYGNGRHELRRKYQRRWCRAVRKHGLPEILCEI